MPRERPPTTEPHIIVGYGVDPGRFRGTRRPMTKLYEDLSTILVCPTFGSVPTKVVESWISMAWPPNGKRVPLFTGFMEVGEAYNQMISLALNDPELSKYRYVMTLEHDNLIPPLGPTHLLREAARGNWDVLGGLYWTKGVDGVAQIWGDLDAPEEHYRPLDPVPGKVMRCAATGMGFTVFKLDLFRRMEYPWFETRDGTEEQNKGLWTQDLFFFHKARAAGIKLKVGVDCRVVVGHFDERTGIHY